MLTGSRSWGNGVPPEDSWGKKAAKVRARMAGRTGRGEPGVSLILAEDETSAETHGPQQIHLPPKKRHKVFRVRTVCMSEPPPCVCIAFGLVYIDTSTSWYKFNCNNCWKMTKVAVKFLLACSALCQCGDVIECLLNRQDVRVQTHVEKEIDGVRERTGNWEGRSQERSARPRWGPDHQQNCLIYRQPMSFTGDLAQLNIRLRQGKHFALTATRPGPDGSINYSD